MRGIKLKHQTFDQLLTRCQPGHTLPQEFYKDPELYDLDLRAIFNTSWLFAGFETEIPEPGTYLSLDLGKSPVLVIRGKDNKIRAFHNTCRHRGSKICKPGKGTTRALICPYHQWNYNLNGDLKIAREMPKSFDRSKHGLKPVHVETAGGVIYICLDSSPPDFEDFKRSIEPLLAPHNLSNSKVAYENQLVEKANWKLVMENARECYHCNACHPMLINSIDIGRSGKRPGGKNLNSDFVGKMSSFNLPVGPVKGEWWDASRNPLRPDAVSISQDGSHLVKRKMCGANDGDVGTMRWGVEPNFFAHALGDYLFAFSAMPTGPEETVVTCKWLVHKDAQEGVDYDVTRLIEVWDTTNREDRDLAENNQLGVNSEGYQPGPYNPFHESYILRFSNWYLDKISNHLNISE